MVEEIKMAHIVSVIDCPQVKKVAGGKLEFLGCKKCVEHGNRYKHLDGKHAEIVGMQTKAHNEEVALNTEIAESGNI